MKFNSREVEVHREVNEGTDHFAVPFMGPNHMSAVRT